MTCGRTGNILHIDLTRRNSNVEETKTYSDRFVGGRGINSKLIFDALDKGVGPYDPENVLVIGSGVLTGTPVPSSARATISSLSPRGLIDSSGIGGAIASEIKYAGYDHIVVHGKSDEPVYLYITNHDVEFKPARRLSGLDSWRTQQAVRKELGDPDIQSLAIGIAGENRVSFAGVSTGRLTSSAGRYGMGAVMGGKNLKAVVVRGKGPVAIARPKPFLKACLAAHMAIRNSPLFISKRESYTDKAAFKRYISKGKFITGNWESADIKQSGFHGLLEDPEKFWQQNAEHLKPHGAQMAGCFGCPMYHETFFHIPEMNDIGCTKCIGWHSMGEIIWLRDRRDILEATCLCDLYGLDAVSTGNCISFLMELTHRGIISAKETDNIVMKRGDMDAIRLAVKKIAEQEGFGAMFKNGVAEAAKQIGKDAAEYAMHIKNLEMFPQEIRAFKSKALLASVGKLEQISLTDDTWPDNPEKMEQRATEMFGNKNAAIPDAYDDKAALVADSENRHAIGDLLGVCKFYIPWGSDPSFKTIAHLTALATGEQFDETVLTKAAKRILFLERAFNAIRGIVRENERPPKRFFVDPVADGAYKGETLSEKKFNDMLADYYRIRDYNSDGIPEKTGFQKLDLDTEWLRYEKQTGDAG